MSVVYTSASRQCRWALLSGPARRGHARSLVWICEYPYRTILTAPSDDCESCRAAVARAVAPRPRLNREVLALERLMPTVSE